MKYFEIKDSVAIIPELSIDLIETRAFIKMISDIDAEITPKKNDKISMIGDKLTLLQKHQRCSK